MARLLSTVIQSVKRRAQRWDSVLETELTQHLEEVIQDICRMFPFWFLKVHPGSTFPLAFFPGDEAALAAYTPVVDNWLDRGWLYVEPGVSNYKVHSPAVPGPDHDDDVMMWRTVPIQRFDYAMLYTMQGNYNHCLEAYNSNDSYRAATRTGYGEGCPTQLVWDTVMEAGQEVSYIRLHPTPVEPSILCCCFTVAYPPNWVPSVGQISNRLLDNYFEVAVAAGMLFTADYFADAALQSYWEMRLWGSPNSARVSNNKQAEGLIAKMKRDTMARRLSDTNTTPGHPGPLNKPNSRQGRFSWRL